MTDEFWEFLQNLVNTSKIVIDRPKGSTHHSFTGKIYPVDYGYLAGTTSIDLGGVDIWVGSQGDGMVVGVLCTVDLLKRDTELKILYDCTDSEINTIDKFINTEQMRAVYIKKSI
jgi:inorganic pyrophosphatase